MPFKIIWDGKAFEELNKFEVVISRRILKKVKELTENPYSKDIRRLMGLEAFKLRIGDYKIIFEIEGDKIFILKIGHRKKDL